MRKIFLALILVFAACARPQSSPSSADGNVGIWNGELTTSADSFAKSVVELGWSDQINGAPDTCTGVIIGRRHILTASHCTLGLAATLQTRPYRIVFGQGVRAETKTILAKSMTSHPDYFRVESLNDLSIIELAEQIPEGFEPAVIESSSGTLDLQTGATVLLAGYGLNGAATKIDDKLRSVQVEFVGAAKANHLLSFKATERGACPGDSGGPAFRDLPSGQRLLVGITSFLDVYGSGCTQGVTAQYTNLVLYHDWLSKIVPDAQFSEQAAQPIVTPANSVAKSKIQVHDNLAAMNAFMNAANQGAELNGAWIKLKTQSHFKNEDWDKAQGAFDGFKATLSTYKAGYAELLSGENSVALRAQLASLKDKNTFLGLPAKFEIAYNLCLDPFKVSQYSLQPNGVGLVNICIDTLVTSNLNLAQAATAAIVDQKIVGAHPASDPSYEALWSAGLTEMLLKTQYPELQLFANPSGQVVYETPQVIAVLATDFLSSPNPIGFMSTKTPFYLAWMQGLGLKVVENQGQSIDKLILLSEANYKALLQKTLTQLK